MKNIKYLVLGLITGLLVVIPMACDIVNPCDSYLEETWSVSNDFPNSGAKSWCKGLCNFEGKDYDKVTRQDFSIGDLLGCYCCK